MSMWDESWGSDPEEPVDEVHVEPEAARRAQEMAQQVSQAITQRMLDSARSQQAGDHVLGVSDLGGCREYVRRMIAQEPFTDEQVSVMPAFIGTAVGSLLEQALGAVWEDSTEQDEVLVTLPSGLALRGHPDIYRASLAVVLDGKTVDGLGVTRRSGPSDQQWWQVHCYALGLHQQGVIEDLSEAWVYVVFLDRSGREAEPLVFAERYSEQRVQDASDWLGDAVYAYQHGEEASKDKPRNWCAACCPYYSDCRADDTDVTGVIEDPQLLDALDTLLDAQRRAREARNDISSAKSVLDGVEGNTGTHSVRWVSVPESRIKAGLRRGYRRLDVRPLTKGK